MNKAAIAGLVLLGLLAAYLLLWPVPIDPLAWTPAVNPGSTGPYAPNDALSAVEHLAPGLGPGPEDVTRGPDGRFYTGLQDGRILRFDAHGAGVEPFADTGGRPLGMQFDAGGRLIVADAFRGLLAVLPDGSVAVLADEVDGRRMLFVDDLDIAADGTIWFSDASQRFDQHHYLFDFWEARATGRLLSHDPVSGRTTVRLEGLRFANGVALGPDDAFVLVTETVGARVLRLWLKGPLAGTQDVFLEGLPAYPDNLSFDGDGLFWIALPAPRIAVLERLAPHPLLRKLLFRLPSALTELEPRPIGWVIGVDTTGRVRHSLQDPTGSYATVTSVNVFDGALYLGSIAQSSVGRIARPATR